MKNYSKLKPNMHTHTHTHKLSLSLSLSVSLSHTHTRTHTRANNNTSTDQSKTTHAHMHTCTHAHMHTCTHAHMHTYTHAHMHTCPHAHYYKEMVEIDMFPNCCVIYSINKSNAIKVFYKLVLSEHNFWISFGNILLLILKQKCFLCYIYNMHCLCNYFK